MASLGPRAIAGETGQGQLGSVTLRRGLWTFATQGLYSASNFALTVLVLVTVPTRTFALFSLVLTTFLLIAQLTRSVVGLPVLIVQSETSTAGDEFDRQFEATGSAGLAVAIGLAAAPVLAALSAAFPDVRAQFLVLLAALPFLLLQDTLRHIAVARGRPRTAAAADGAWVAIHLVASAVALAAGTASAAVLLGLWAAAGAASGLFLAGALHVRPAVRRSLRWLQSHLLLCRRLAVEFLATSGSYYATSYGLAMLAGAEHLGYFRAAQTLFGPASVLLLGGFLFGVPESARVRHQTDRLLRFAVRLSAALAALSLACGVAVYALLPLAGPELFPDSWAPIRRVIPWITLFGAAIGAGAGPTAGLRVLDENRWILDARALTGVVALAIGLALSAVLGAPGAVAGLAAGECLLAARAWARLSRHTSRSGTAAVPAA